ncbi:TPA: hypothetical protein N0F65_008197, partial [Lagenidium giganteum]
GCWVAPATTDVVGVRLPSPSNDRIPQKDLHHADTHNLNLEFSQRSSSRLTQCPSLAVAALVAPAMAAGATGNTICQSDEFKALKASKLGDSPITAKSLVKGKEICIEYALTGDAASSAGWFAVGLSRSGEMVSKPNANVMVFQKSKGKPESFKIAGKSSRQVSAESDQTFFKVGSSSKSDMTFSFQRTLEAATDTEVEIDPKTPGQLIWAYGDKWPISGHKAGTYGGESINFGGDAGAAAPSTPPKKSTGKADICESAEFTALKTSSLGSSPIAVKSLIKGDSICIEYSLTGSAAASATWLGVGLAREASMVSSPAANVMMFFADKTAPESHIITAKSSSGVKLESDQSFFQAGPTTKEGLKFSFQRKLTAAVPSEVTIPANGDVTLIWSFGDKWPISSHKTGTRGIETLNFATGVSSTASEGFCATNNCTGIIGAIAFGVMLVGGLLFSVALKSTSIGRLVLHKTLIAPPLSMTSNAMLANPVSMVLQNLADLRIGESFIMIAFIGAIVAVVIAYKNASVQVITGQVALIILMFLVLPIARIPLWTVVFGSSFERVVKFHRWLGMAMTIATVVHLIYALDVVSVTATTGGTVHPLFGFIAFLCFVTMSAMANEYVRRKMFEVFYFSHRVLSIAGFVFTILHAPAKIGYPLALPLAFYGIGVLLRWWMSFTSKYQANLTISESAGATTLQLERSAKTTQFAAKMDECSYFWINVPTVSVVQWHPFSAIVTPDGQSIAFCVKAMGPGTFTDTLFHEAKSKHAVNISLCGPFGKPSIDVDAYDVVVMVAGGVGITPMLSLLNQKQAYPGTKSVDYHVVWAVRHEADLLMCEALMPSQNGSTGSVQDPNAPMSTASAQISWDAHVSKASAEGFVTCKNGDRLAYRPGRPVMDEVINSSRFMGKRVAVLACGPPMLVVDAQKLARQCGFDFHKETFSCTDTENARCYVPAVLVAPVTAAGATSTDICVCDEFQALKASKVGDSPITAKSLVKGKEICIEYALTGDAAASAGWFAVGLSRSGDMVSKPNANVMVFQKSKGKPESFKIAGQTSKQVAAESDQTFFKVGGASATDMKFSFQRALDAATDTEVAIDPKTPGQLIWAYGDTWPITGHKAGTNGVESISFSGAAATGSASGAASPSTGASTPAKASTGKADVCASAEFSAAKSSRLGTSPINIKSLIKGDSICIEYALTGSDAASSTWFAVGVSRDANMVSSPAANVMMYFKDKATPQSYLITSRSSSGVKLESDQSFFQIGASSKTELKFSFQRKLAGSTASEVAIPANGDVTLIWAYGSKWPISSHKSGTRGIETMNFATGASTAGGVNYCTTHNCTGIIGAIALGIMLAGGFLFSVALKSTSVGHLVLHKTLIAPPVSWTTNAKIAHPVAMVLQNLADVRVGELFMILAFYGAVAAVAISHKAFSIQVITGQIALIMLMFLILPIARVPLWTVFFGSSFERIVKFHRWLGMAMTVVTIVHLILALDVVSVTDTTYGAVHPLYGFIGFLCFITLSSLANEIVRRLFFEVFYFSHRVLSIVGYVFVILHAPTKIGYPLILPLVLYGIGLLLRWWMSFTSKYQASLTVSDSTGATILLLERNAKTTQFAAKMDECSYFWINVPTVSVVQWHPFSAIVTPDGQSIAFCVKAMGPGTFTDTLFHEAKSKHAVNISLCGPFGKPSIDVDAYDVVVMVAGGVGITPMLSLLNQKQAYPGTKSVDYHVVWAVRHEADLLMCEALMPSQNGSAGNVQDAHEPLRTASAQISWDAHVSKASADGYVNINNGDRFNFRSGRPVLDETINSSRFMGKRVAVMACGPPTLVVEAQNLARQCGFDFHKEEFNCAEFAALKASPLGASPMTVKSLVKGDSICLEYAFTGSDAASTTWFAVGVGESYGQLATGKRDEGQGRARRTSSRRELQVVLRPKATRACFYEVGPSSKTELKFSFQRKLAGSTASEVAIPENADATLIWAYGSTWPIRSHKPNTRGVEMMNFATGVSTAMDEGFCATHNCTRIIGAIALGVMLSTSSGHFVLHKTLISPPVHWTINSKIAHPVAWVLQNLADIRIGESFMIFAFYGAVAAVAISHKAFSIQVITGQIALIMLMFLILPIARVPLWTVFFGSSFERIVKFHRWLGMAMTVVTIVHLILALDVVSVTDTTYGAVHPLYGFIGFLCFITLSSLANEIVRRLFFEVFYFSHRVLSIVGYVFVIRAVRSESDLLMCEALMPSQNGSAGNV